ncbi:MAG: hypothetical protein MUE85_10340 [Microscillaceae bacterium]|jgi:hypothetical protein|nr:hypothetical protein [Microscillaceae bacterium]
MKLFIHLELIEALNLTKSPGYQKPLLESLKKTFPEVLGYDLDNFSDAHWIDTQIKLIAEAEKVFVYIISDKNAKTQALLRFFEKLIRCPQPLQVWAVSENLILNKLLKPLGERLILNSPPDNLENQLAEFWAT